MKDELRNLMNMGFTEGESKVYIALLKLGSSTVGSIVEESGVSYSNVYEILQRLINKGMASFIIKGKVKYFQPAPPDNLLDYIERKEKELESQRLVLKDFIPKLKTYQKIKPEQNAEIFIGLKGLKAAYLKLASEFEGKEWLFFYIHKPAYAKESDIFYKNLSKWFKSLKIPNRGICNNDYVKSRFAKKAKFLKIKYVDFPIPANIDICNDRILIVSWSQKPIAFLIKSKEITDSMREYFEDVWKVAKK